MSTFTMEDILISLFRRVRDILLGGSPSHVQKLYLAHAYILFEKVRIPFMTDASQTPLIGITVNTSTWASLFKTEPTSSYQYHFAKKA